MSRTSRSRRPVSGDTSAELVLPCHDDCSASPGGRAILGTAQMVQAVSLRDRESPLVRVNNFQVSEAFDPGAHSPVDGMVQKVTRDQIRIREQGTGELRTLQLFSDMPLNRGVFLNPQPLVNRSNQVKVGTALGRYRVCI